MALDPQTTASVVGAYPCSADFTWAQEPSSPARYFLTAKDTVARSLIVVELDSGAVLALALAMHAAAKVERPVPDLES